ncbi:MAG: adenylate/guanylate cyclase domain-containing protein [Pseudomonadota bacterium]
MRPRYIRIRIAVLTIVMLLISAALAAVSIKWVTSSLDLAHQIQEREAQTIFQASASELNNTFGRAPAILNKFSRNIKIGAVDHKDLDNLATLFATELQNAPFLTWISYGTRADGAFVGATRRDGSIVINMSVPSRVQGRTQEWVFGQDGELTPIDALVPERFDPRGREWFYQGYLRSGVSWTRPYEFREGGLGVTSVKAMIGRNPVEWVGTMTADFNIDAIKERLMAISSKVPGSLILAVRGKEDVYVSVDSDGGAIIEGVKALSVDQARLSGQGEFTVQDSATGTTEQILYAAFPLDLVEGLQIDLVYVVAVQSSVFGIAQRNLINTILLSIVIIAVVMIATVFTSRSIARPIENVGQVVSRLSLDRLDDFQPFGRHWLKEINQTRKAMNEMVAGLQRGEEIRSTFGRYIPEALASALEEGSVEIDLGGHQAEVTALFTDIEGFTTISESVSSSDLVILLNRYFAEVLDVIERNNGMVVDFIGDGLFAIFGAPVAHDNHRDMGIRCALELIERTEAFERELAAEGQNWGRTRIGLNSGPVVAGNVGGAGRQKYTALGDVVNTAARIEGLNKQVGTRMLASASTVNGSTVEQRWRSLGQYQFVGKAKPVEMFEAVEQIDDTARLDAFAKCLNACRETPDDAEPLIDAFTDEFGEDKALTMHLTQIKAGHGSDVILLHKK